jgi:hypothetical protein
MAGVKENEVDLYEQQVFVEKIEREDIWACPNIAWYPLMQRLWSASWGQKAQSAHCSQTKLHILPRCVDNVL